MTVPSDFYRDPSYLQLCVECRTAVDRTPFLILADWLQDRVEDESAAEIRHLRAVAIPPSPVPGPASIPAVEEDETRAAWLRRLGLFEFPAGEGVGYRWATTVCTSEDSRHAYRNHVMTKWLPTVDPTQLPRTLALPSLDPSIRWSRHRGRAARFFSWNRAFLVPSRCYPFLQRMAAESDAFRLERGGSPALTALAGDFIRERLRETGFMRRLMPPTPVSDG